jgi:hypothetical protein
MNAHKNVGIHEKVTFIHYQISTNISNERVAWVDIVLSDLFITGLCIEHVKLKLKKALSIRNINELFLKTIKLRGKKE